MLSDTVIVHCFWLLLDASQMIVYCTHTGVEMVFPRLSCTAKRTPGVVLLVSSVTETLYAELGSTSISMLLSGIPGTLITIVSFPAFIDGNNVTLTIPSLISQ